MEINLLLLIKYIGGGLFVFLLGWAGWLHEDRKTLKVRIRKLEYKVQNIETKIENTDSKTSQMIEERLRPLQHSLDLMAKTTETINMNITKLLSKTEEKQC